MTVLVLLPSFIHTLAVSARSIGGANREAMFNCQMEFTMKLASCLSVFAIFILVGCSEEGAFDGRVSHDPTPAQLSQALSDPLLVAATEALASDGLAVDPEASHVITDDAGNWGLVLPVARLYTGGVVPYESLVYEVYAGAADVYFVMAVEGDDAVEVEPELGIEASSTEPRLGQATFNADACGPWTNWMRTGWQCRPSLNCPWNELFANQERSRNCWDGRLRRWYRQTQRRQVSWGCGC